MAETMSFKEKRIKNIVNLYYSRPDVQKALFDFSQNREIAPKFMMSGFGKRPDSFQYPNDVFEMVKKGATSFHCSEELWKDPLKIVTGMNEKDANALRVGWDLLLDIDCKWFEYSKLAAQAIIKVLNDHGVKNIGVKFSGSKGFHILVPWKSFPKEIRGEQTKDLFPEIPRKIISYIRFHSEKAIRELLPSDFYERFKNTELKRGIKCSTCGEIVDEQVLREFFCPVCKQGQEKIMSKSDSTSVRCPSCGIRFELRNSEEIFICKKCNIDSRTNPSNFTKSIEIDLFELMGLDVVLVSPRHLFRMPYSLHEKTALASVVISPEEIPSFDLRNADPLKVQIRNFSPDSKEGEARSLLVQALDWQQEKTPEKSEQKKNSEFKPVKLEKLSIQNFPPCIKKILNGMTDGKKRAVFILINLFRSVGMEREELEQRLIEWNKKNKPPLKEGYLKTQISWSYMRKPLMPPNCKEYYRGLGVCIPDEMCNLVKNPVNYTIRKNQQANKKSKK